MAWHNRGLIYKPRPPWTHGMLPVVRMRENDWADIYFSSRYEGHSCCLMMEFDLDTGANRQTDFFQAWTNGFMRDGVSPLWLIDDSLYIMGWRKNKKWGVQETTGILNLKTGKITAPKVQPGYQVNVVTCVVDPVKGTGPLWEVYYDGADKFVSPTERHYSVKMQLFLGDTWLTEPETIFPQIGNESRTSCFRVLGDEGWFCAADGDSRIYHIWEARRVNNKWERVCQLDLGTEDWCSESQCYPFPVIHNGRKFIFFSGNDYGRDGFGMAEYL